MAELSTAERMVLRTIRSAKRDNGIRAKTPSMEGIDAAIDRAGRSLTEYIGAAWEAAQELVYDEFPQFREEGT